MSQPDHRTAVVDALLMGLEPIRRHIAVWRAAWSVERRRPRLARRTADELAFLPAVVEIVETPPSPVGRATMAAIMAFCTIALAWSCLGELDIHATAQGRIIAGGKTKAVAASELATVGAIRVQDGDRVAPGQVLVELDPTAPKADVERLRGERLEQLVAVTRLKALLDGAEDLSLPADLQAPPALVAVHRQQLRQKRVDHRAAIEALDHERQQREAERRGAQADLKRLEQTVPLLAERARTGEEMAAKGWQSRTEYLRRQQDYIDRRQELEAARHKVDEVDSAVAAVTEHQRQAEAQFRGEALAELAAAEQKAGSLGQELAKAEERVRLYTLTAPVAGRVQQLAVHAAGAVVSPAQPVLMIVPENEGIAVEAALENKDVGFVLPGQTVEIKVESFPFTRYGTIPARVVHVSGDAVEGPDSDAILRQGAGGSAGAGREGVYAVRIEPLVDHIRADGRDVPLTPGMAVTAEIKTGKRRVIEYLLDPVLRTGRDSLRER